MPLPISSGTLPQVELFNPLPNTQQSQINLVRKETLEQAAAPGASRPDLFLAGSVAALADTFLESFGILGEDQLEDFLKQNLPEFGHYFAENRGAVGAVGDIAGLFIPGTIAAKAVRTTGFLGKTAQRVFGKESRKFFSTGLSNQRLFNAQFQRARNTIAKGVNNLDADPVFAAQRKRLIRRSYLDVATENVAADIAIAVSMRESEFLFPEEMSMMDNLALFGATNVAITGLAALGARATMRRGITRATDELQDAVRNPRGVAVMDALANTKGERGTALAIYASWLSDVKQRVSDTARAGDEVTSSAALRDKTVIEQRLKQVTADVFRDAPLENVTRSHAPKETRDPHIETMIRAYEKDPSVGYGVWSLEPFQRENSIGFESRLKTEIERNRADHLLAQQELEILQKKQQSRPTQAREELIRKRLDKIQRLQEKVDQLNSTVSLVAEIDGSTTALTGRAAMFQDGERRLARLGQGDVAARVGDEDIIAMRDGTIMKSPDVSTFNFDIDVKTGKFIPKSPGAERVTMDMWEGFSHEQRTAVFDAMQGVVEGFEKTGVSAWKGMALSRESTFLELDFAAEMIQRYGDAARMRITGIESLDDLTYRSLAGKFDAFQRIRTEAVKAYMRGEDHPYLRSDNIARALNLPGDKHVLLRFFESQRVAHPDLRVSLDAVTGGNMDGLRKALRVEDGLDPAADLAGLETRASMLNMPRDGRPVHIITRNMVNRAGVQPEDLAFAAAQLRAQQLNKLQRATDASLVQATLSMIDTNPDMVQSFKTGLRSLIEGNRSSGFLTRHLVQKGFAHREQPGFAAADLLQDTSNKAVEKQIERLLDARIANDAAGNPISRKQAFNELLRGDRTADLNMFMTARHALGAGWDIADDWIEAIEQAGDQTKYGIKLASTERNKKIWFDMYKEEMPTGGAVLLRVSNDKTSVALSETALRAMRGLNDLQQELLTNINAIRHSRNLAPIPRKALHLPFLDLTRKHLAYLIDEAGRTRHVVGENSLPELQRRVKQEIENAEKAGMRLRPVSEDTLERYYDARSRAWFDISDFSRPGNQTGQATGKGFGRVIDTGPVAFTDMLQGTLRQFGDVGREVRRTVFEPELQYLRMQKAAAQAAGVSPTERTIFDELATTLIGSSKLDPNTWPGAILLGVEHAYEQGLQIAFDKLPRLTQPGKASSRRAEREFDALKTEYGEYNPFRSMEDFLERTQRSRMPVSLRRHAGALNEVTVGLAIRMFDLGMGVINIASLASTLPSVVAMLPKRADESVAQWRARIGAFSTVTDGNNVYFSPAKAVTSGIHFMFSAEGRKVAQIARAEGMFDQYAAELVDVFGRTGESYITGVLRNFSNKVSVATDWTERQARAISWMTMYNIGKKGLQLDDRTARVFAHRQANNTIADFRPSNRPTIFQGAAGMPLGLFTTYMWNFLQRFVSLIEDRSVRAATWQVGLQASLFGSEALPGWDQYTNLAFENYDGTVNIVDRLNEAFGHTATDVFMNGTVANLPRLFGAPDGISIGPRAGIGLPFERGLGVQSIAGLRTIQRIGSTFGKIIDDTVQDRGLDPVQAAEFIAASGINKGISHAIELFTGESIDHAGNIIEADTRSAMGILSRTIGFKPLMADELRQENVRNRASERMQRELKERLSLSLRNKIRRGKLRSDDVENALESYARAGGNAENFRQFFRSQVLRGEFSKLDREIADSLRGSIDDRRLGRLLYLDRD